MPPLFRIPTLGARRVSGAPQPAVGRGAKPGVRRSWVETLRAAVGAKPRRSAVSAAPAGQTAPAVADSLPRAHAHAAMPLPPPCEPSVRAEVAMPPSRETNRPIASAAPSPGRIPAPAPAGTASIAAHLALRGQEVPSAKPPRERPFRAASAIPSPRQPGNPIASAAPPLARSVVRTTVGVTPVAGAVQNARLTPVTTPVTTPAPPMEHRFADHVARPALATQAPLARPSDDPAAPAPRLDERPGVDASVWRAKAPDVAVASRIESAPTARAEVRPAFRTPQESGPAERQVESERTPPPASADTRKVAPAVASRAEIRPSPLPTRADTLRPEQARGSEPFASASPRPVAARTAQTSTATVPNVGRAVRPAAMPAIEPSLEKPRTSTGISASAAQARVATVHQPEQTRPNAQVAEPPPAAGHAEPRNGDVDRPGSPRLRVPGEVPSHPADSTPRAAAPAAPALAASTPHGATAVETHAIARAIVARDLPTPGAQPRPPAEVAAKSAPAAAEPRRTSSSEGATPRESGSRAGADASSGRGPAPRTSETSSAAPSAAPMPIAAARATTIPTPATFEVGPPRLTQGSLAEAIVSQARALPGTGAVEVHFVMEPAELGAVKVRIQTRGHEVRVDIAASSSGAASALAEGIPRLTAQLELAGYRQPEVSLTLDLAHDGRGANPDRGAEPGHPRPHHRHHAHVSGPMRKASSSALDRTI